MQIFYGLMIPLLGTALGSACVFFLRNQFSERLQRLFSGFAGGVMVAASIWSLLVPALNQAAAMGKLACFPAAIGFMLGVFFMLGLDRTTPHMHGTQEEGPKNHLRNTTKLLLAVTIHNIPEGIAVGVIYAGFLSGTAEISLASALVLSVGIAIQNFPEGAIISLPLSTHGISRTKSFVLGTLSGVVEPIAAGLTLVLAGLVVPILPYLLSFAAGVMIYVVVEELIPEMSEGTHSNVGVLAFSVGFVLMMILDVALG